LKDSKLLGVCSVRFSFSRGFGALLLLLLLGGGAGAWWLWVPSTLAQPVAEVSIEPGTSPKEVAAAVARSGVAVNPTLLYWWFRLSGQSRQIRAGSYEWSGQASPWQILQKLVRGDASSGSVTLVEGWNIRQVREALRKADRLKPDTAQLSDAQLMQSLGRPGEHPEGRFFPDTYTFSKGSSDTAVLRRAMRAMDKHLAAAWTERNPKVPLRTPEEALILASIIEKETGKISDQPEISAVFHNRLILGMRLQTDPTVIYGMGTRFDGNIRKSDLTTDTPYNTYTREGLPPSPISMPGKAALRAALHPIASKALYFVARGDGSSEFSTTLEAHNRAVNKYQRSP
jgi:UPF0755 protein